MAKLKLNEYQKYMYLKEQGFLLQLISGKWFLNGQEYQLYAKGGICYFLSTYAPNYFGSSSDLNSFIKWFTDTMNEPDGDWPELSILTKAKAKMATGYYPESIAYPLNEKELMILHYFLDSDPKDTYAIFFHGIGGSGKTTICNIIAAMFGSSDTSNCNFSNLGEKFARETLAGKRLWYDTDINANWSEGATNTLKKVITHDTDQFEKKGKNPYTAQYRCKALFCCNVAPKFDVTDSGVLRRIIYYNKNTKIENPDGNLKDKVYTEAELIDMAIAALSTNIDNFYETFEDETKKIIMSTNNVARYGIVSTYDTYRVECSSAGVYPYSLEKWEKLKELFEEWISTSEKKKLLTTKKDFVF